MPQIPVVKEPWKESRTICCPGSGSETSMGFQASVYEVISGSCEAAGPGLTSHKQTKRENQRRGIMDSGLGIRVSD